MQPQKYHKLLLDMYDSMPNDMEIVACFYGRKGPLIYGNVDDTLFYYGPNKIWEEVSVGKDNR